LRAKKTKSRLTLSESILKRLKKLDKPVVAVINKMDLTSNEKVMPVAMMLHEEWGIADIFPISAKLGFNVESLIVKLCELAPENPFLYGEHEKTTQTNEQIVSEYVREQIFINSDKELPYSVLIRMERFEETPEAIIAEATLLVEHTRHRRILIGEKGAFIANLRRNAVRRLKQYFSRPVKLALWVKVQHPSRGSNFS